MTPLVTILAVSALFFVIIPGIGAFGVRRRWQRFRVRVTQASTLPHLTYALLHQRQAEPLSIQFLGSLESIQDDKVVWIRGENFTAEAVMGESEVFFLRGTDAEPEENPPIRIQWSRIGSLPAGIRVLVSGVLDTSGPRPVLCGSPGRPLFVLFFDGPRHTLVRRSVWSGRQLNEYWNSVTPASLIAGALSLIVLGYLFTRQAQLLPTARFALALAATPILPLLPPGVGFFYLYRLSWRRGRRLRAHRDVLRLPLRYFPNEQERCVELPSGEMYCEVELQRDAVGLLVQRGVHVAHAPAGARQSAPEAARIYGRPAPEGVAAPADPLAEWVVVPGDPRELAPGCNRRARQFELLSGTLFTAAMTANFLLVLIVIARLI